MKRTVFHGYTHSEADEKAKQEWFERELSNINKQCRLGCFIDRSDSHDRQWDSRDRFFDSLSDDQLFALSSIPHLIVPRDCQSTFATFFGKAPYSFVQFNNITITDVTDNPQSVTSNSFITNHELSQFLNECAMKPSRRMRICGTICSDVGYVIQKSHLEEMQVTFECSLSPLSHVVEDYAVKWTAKSNRTNSYDNRMSTNRYDALKRPCSVESMLQDSLRSINQSINQNLKWINLTAQQLVDADDAFKQQIARCDQHDAKLQARLVDHLNTNSPGVCPVIVNVDNESIKISARFKLTPTDLGIPMTGAIDDKCRVVFKVSPCVDRLEHYDMKDVILYHGIRTRNRGDDPRSDFLQRFGTLAKPVINDISVTVKLEHFVSVVVNPCFALEGNIQIWDDLQLEKYVFQASIEFRRGRVSSTCCSGKFALCWTLQQSHAPADIWALRDCAQPYQTISETGKNRVDLFIVRDHQFGDMPLIFRDCYGHDESSFSQEVALYVDAESCDDPDKVLHLSVDVASSIALHLYDKFKSHHEAKSNNDVPQLRFQTVLIRHFPSMKFNIDYMVRLTTYIRLFGPHDTYATQINSTMDVKGVTVGMQYGGFVGGGLRLRFRSKHVLSIPQFLDACNLCSSLVHFPALLLDRVRLSECMIRVEDPCTEKAKMYAHARTGTKKSDRFVVVKGNSVKLDHNAHEWEWLKDTVLIKVHDSKLISTQYCSVLKKFGSSGCNHSFVYLDATRTVKENGYWNCSIHNVLYSPKLPRVCEIPESTVVPIGSHFLSIKHQKSVVWTCASDEAMSIDETESQRCCVSTDSQSADNRPQFDLPLKLLEYSTQLAQFLFTFVDINSCMFNVGLLSHAHHKLRGDGSWWKRRITSEFGQSVTRWSDATLVHWRHEWLTAVIQARTGQERKRQRVELNVLAQVESQAIWFSAAVFLVTRLNRFAKEFLRQPDRSFTLPAALRHVLLITPPFQSSPSHLSPRYELRSQETMCHMSDYYRNAQQNQSTLWIAYVDQEQHSHYLAFYTGSSYVQSDHHTERLGVALDDGSENEDEDPSDIDQSGSEDEDQQDDTTSAAGSQSKQIREVLFSDPDLWPVLEWEPSNLMLWLEATCFHEFCIKNGVFKYCDQLSVLWDKRETALTIPPTEPLTDEYDIKESDYESNEDEWSDEQRGDKRAKVEPFPLLAPPFRVRFDRALMKRVLHDLQEEIEPDC